MAAQTLARAEFTRLARRGAEIEAQDHVRSLQRIKALFPDIPTDIGLVDPVLPARRGRMTPAGRKRISDLMKQRWAEAKKKKRNRL